MNNIINNIIHNFSPGQLALLFHQIAPDFRLQSDSLSAYLKDDEPFSKAQQLGVIEFSNTQTVIVAAIQTTDRLTERSSKRKQYELTKRIIKANNHNAGIFAFYDEGGRFQLHRCSFRWNHSPGKRGKRHCLH